MQKIPAIVVMLLALSNSDLSRSSSEVNILGHSVPLWEGLCW